jgi:single-stranded-DNA-specific exonuclease
VSLPDSRWRAKPYSYADADAVSRELGVSPVVASILARRGCDTPDKARAFMAGDESHDPFAFRGIDAACALILDHVARGSRIVVHGDYDVDGVASTAILLRALRALGADPGWLLPSRFEEGYGLAVSSVDRLHAEGCRLLITADCAITAVDEVAHARALGMDVVVTDHHRPAERLPDCPIVHPVVSGYPFADLCAAGVAYKLGAALYATAGRDPALVDEDLDLVALATIADLVPLKGENRRLTRAGLARLAETQKPGLWELMRISKVEPGRVDAHAVGFRLAPRINAAGRLQRADAGLELVMTSDPARAIAIADELDLLNRERQDTETRLLFAAEAARAEFPDDAPAYVLAGEVSEGWHPGVIGIVASRIVERHHRPTVLIALDGDSGKGSGRSISAFDLHGGLAAASSFLNRFGGHRAAAGLDIDRANVDAFRDAFVAHAGEVLAPEDLIPEERVDAIVPGGALGLPLCEELAQLAPFGFGNPQPTLLVPAARIVGVRGMGQEKQHSSFNVVSGGARARAVAFRTLPSALESRASEPQDVAVRIELNEWNGRQEARLVLRAVCATEAGAVADVGAGEGFWVRFERELAAPLSAGPSRQDAGELAVLRPRPRSVVDRTGEGFAGVAGDLISAGESVLVVCADVSRRRASLERLIAGLSDAPLAVCSWQALESDPSIAESYVHVVALDPPVSDELEELLATAPAPVGGGFSHSAWGPAESEFALAVARAGLDLRPALVGLYRALREKPAAGGDLEDLLRGDGPHPRPPEVAARMIRVLSELGLIAYERDGAGHPAARVLDAPRTELERSPAYQSYMARLAAIEKRLAPAPAEPVQQTLVAAAQ